MHKEPITRAGHCPLSQKNNSICSGMGACALLAVCMFCTSCSGKNTAQRLNEVEVTAQENQGNIAEVSHRVAALESRMDSLSGEVRQINTRTYEVRNKAGRKTGMTAHPVIPPAPPTVTSAAPYTLVPPATMPTAVPAAMPGQVVPAQPANTQQKLKASLPSMNDVPAPMTIPGQAQPTRGNPSPSLSLPPTEAASAPIPQPAGTAVSSAGVQPSVAAPAPVAPPWVANAQRKHSEQTQSAPKAQTAPKTQTVAPVTAPVTQAPKSPQDTLALPPESATAVLPVAQNAPQATASPAAQAVSAAKLPSAAKGEEGAYKGALSLVMSGHAAEGRQKFNEFLQSYPSGRYAANAHYWIGESYYAQGNYPEALMSFKQVSTQFPRHHKTADALLKAGMTYQKLGDKENAQLQFKALQSDFPHSEAASRVRRR